MKPEVYRLPHGRHVPVNQVERHHVAFMRRWFKTPLEKHYRSLGGLVLPIQGIVHRELHAKSYPPPKPSSELMINIVDFDDEQQSIPQIQRFHAIIDFLGDISVNSHSYERSDEAQRLQENFIEQARWIDKAIATPIYDKF